MQSAKFIEVLKTFSKEEFKKFGLVINSPYFNSEKVLITLFDIIKKYYPDFDSGQLDKQKVFAKLYPGKDYNDALMRNVHSDMLKLTEEFLVFESYKGDDFNFRTRLMNSFSKRKLIKQYEKNLAKAESLLENLPLRNIEYYKNRLIMERLKNSNELLNKDIYVNVDVINSRRVIAHNITAVFLMEMIYINFDIANTQKKYEFNYTYNFEHEIDSFLAGSGKKYLEIPHIKYYHYIFKLLTTNDEKYYQLLKEFADITTGELSREELRDLFICLTTYCTVRIGQGDEIFVSEIFHIYKKMVERNVFTSAAGTIPNVFFMNFVVTGLEAGETELVESFLAEKKEEIKDSSKTDTIHFCNAMVSYYKKEYSSAITELSKITGDDMTYKHNIKSLYLKLYFDLNDIEPFLSHTDSYKHFISKNKLIYEPIRDSVNNYISFTKRLFCIKNNIGKNDEFNLPLLKRELKKCGPIINRPWLLRKIEEIE